MAWQSSSGKGDEYERFLIERTVPDYSSVDGLLKLYFTQKDEDTVAHFLLVTIWDSMESSELPRPKG